MTVKLGIVGNIISSCIVKETLPQVIVGAAQTTRTIRDAALDINVPIASQTALWSTQAVAQSGSLTIDMTALPRSQPTDAGATTFDATGLRVLWWRIRNKHATNWLTISSAIANGYPLFGTGWLPANPLPVSANGGFRDGFDGSNLPLVDATHKLITLSACLADGTPATGLNCEVSILVDQSLNANP